MDRSCPTFSSSDLFRMFSKCGGLTTLIYTGKLPDVSSLQNAVAANANLKKIHLTTLDALAKFCSCATSFSFGGPLCFSLEPVLHALQTGQNLQTIWLDCRAISRRPPAAETKPKASVSNGLLAYRMRTPFVAKV